MIALAHDPCPGRTGNVRSRPVVDHGRRQAAKDLSRADERDASSTDGSRRRAAQRITVTTRPPYQRAITPTNDQARETRWPRDEIRTARDAPICVPSRCRRSSQHVVARPLDRHRRRQHQQRSPSPRKGETEPPIRSWKLPTSPQALHRADPSNEIVTTGATTCARRVDGRPPRNNQPSRRPLPGTRSRHARAQPFVREGDEHDSLTRGVARRRRRGHHSAARRRRAPNRPPTAPASRRTAREA